MSYRDMVRDAGLDPDSSEGRDMAQMIEDEEQRAWMASQEPDPCPYCWGSGHDEHCEAVPSHMDDMDDALHRPKCSGCCRACGGDGIA